MNINLLLEEFDNLNESKAIIISFKSFKPYIMDNNDIIRVDGDVLQIKNTGGNIVINIEEINGFQVLEKSDVMERIISIICGE